MTSKTNQLLSEQLLVKTLQKQLLHLNGQNDYIENAYIY